MTTQHVMVPRHSLWNHPTAIILVMGTALSLVAVIVAPIAVANSRVFNAEPVVVIPPIVIPSTVTVAPSPTAAAPTETPTATVTVTPTEVVLPDVWNCVVTRDLVPSGGYFAVSVTANTGRLWLLSEVPVTVKFGDGHGGWLSEYQIGPEGALVELPSSFLEIDGGDYVYVMDQTATFIICFPPDDWVP